MAFSPNSSSNPSTARRSCCLAVAAVFEAWIATPEPEAPTASPVHQTVDYRPITRYHVTAGYLNLADLATMPDGYPTSHAAEETRS